MRIAPRCLPVVWLLAGCVTPALPTDDKDTDLGSDTEVVVDTEAPTVEDSEEAWDTSDTETPEDTDDPVVTPPAVTGPCHMWDPFVDAGWWRRYQVSYNGNTGTERHDGIGAEASPSGLAAYAVDVVVNAGASSTSGRDYFGCDYGDAGAYTLGWIRQQNQFPFGLQTLIIVPDTPRKHLPSVSAMSAVPTWSFDIDATMWINTTQGSQAMVGTVIAFGEESVTVPKGTYDAYKFVIEYTETRNTSTGGGLFQQIFGALFQQLFSDLFGAQNESGEVHGQSELWYVEGIGLVKQVTIDADTGTVLVTKEMDRCENLPSCP